MIYYILSYTQNTLSYTNLNRSKTLKDPRWLWPDRMVKPSPQIKWLILASPGCFEHVLPYFVYLRAAAPAAQLIKQNWHTYSSVLRAFGFSPFSYVYFDELYLICLNDIYLIKYFDIVRKPTHQTLSPPWAVPRRLQPECGSWAREFLNR